MIPIYEHHVTVLDSDIDENRHANNQCYLRWMNEAAVAHSAVNDWTARRYVELGATWFARKHIIEYLLPVFEGEKLVVETGIVDWKHVRSTRRYRIIRISDDQLVARGETLWCFVNMATGKPARIPPEIAEAFTVVKLATGL